MKPIDPADLPTLAQLHGASAGAVVFALLLTVTTVLPAEWAIDPTGAGRMLGLTAMGELKVAGEAGPPSITEAPFEQREDRIEISLRPGQGTEVKAVMRAGDALTYRWKADTELFYDFHGEPENAGADVFTSYERGFRAVHDGTFEAPFLGTHGWYWKNRTEASVTLELTVEGVYQSVGQR